MASVNKSSRSAAKSSRGLSLNVLLGALLSCTVVAGSAWGLAVTIGTMQEASRTLSDGKMHLKLAVADGYRPEPKPKAIKSARVQKPLEREIRADELSAEAILTAHQRSVAIQVAMAESRKKAEEARILTAYARVRSAVEREEKIDGTPSVVTALVEDIPVKDIEPFDLVLAKEDPEDAEEAVTLPSQIPLPEARPLMETVVTDPKPADEKPVTRKNPDTRSGLAYAKPERSLFGDLFKSRTSGGAWPGKGTKVAIYDVSNATVYLPDGTKLRAHSGIGTMRDNPRYEHVTMKGPTPAGIYRLSMREKRFYGVEAIRMTSIDGRDPKNRTGLLTHTNLLRGQIGSHGCVAFQNYQPFLNAFKRGKVTMMVVVPELPSSRTQLAALYRKAGA